MNSLRAEKPTRYLPPRTWTRDSEPGCPQLSPGEEEGVLALASGMELLQPPCRVPPPAHLCRELGTRRPARPCSQVAPWPQSSGAGRRNHPVGWPPPPRGPLPEGQGLGTLAAGVARSSRGAASAAGRRRPAPPPRPQLPPTARCAARRLAPAGWRGRSHTHSEGASKVPRRLGVGAGSRRRPPPRHSCPLRSYRRGPSATPRRPGSKPQSRIGSKVREGSRVGRQTGVRAGGGLSWV